MKKFIQVFYFIFAGLIITSCSKNDVTEINSEQNLESASENNAPAFYYFNSSPVAEGSFDPEEESNHTLVLLKLDEAGQKYIEVHGFSTLENYFQYGNAHGMPLEEKYNIEQHLADYAVTSGAVAEYETTGVEPQWYTDYVNSYLEGSSLNAKARLATTVHTEYYGGGSAWVFTTLASSTMMGGAFSNNVSSFTPLHIYGFTTFYDKMFYQKRLATFWNFGWTTYSFDHLSFKFIDNKTSSMIFGL